jgi:hypothetical protein
MCYVHTFSLEEEDGQEEDGKELGEASSLGVEKGKLSTVPYILPVCFLCWLSQKTGIYSIPHIFDSTSIFFESSANPLVFT